MAINDKLNGKTNKKKQNYDKEKASNLLKTANLLQTYETTNYAKYPIYASTVRLRRGTMFVFHMHYTVRFRSARCVNSTSNDTLNTVKQISHFMKMTLLIDVVNTSTLSRYTNTFYRFLVLLLFSTCRITFSFCANTKVSALSALSWS